MLIFVFEIESKLSNFNNNKQNRKNNAYLSYNHSNKTGERLSIHDDEIQIVGTKPSSNYQFSPIGREEVVPHAG